MTHRIPLRILIVAEHASARFGGEAILPLHYFRVLRARGADVRLIVHARTQRELTQLFPRDLDRITFIPDTWLNVLLWRASQVLPVPQKARDFTLGWLNRAYTQVRARAAARAIIRQHHVEIVHQPIPVSPREPSFLVGLGVTVVIGPMNGGMSYPPGLSSAGGWRFGSTAVLAVARHASDLLNRIIPGKLRAAVLLVANERTRRSLPRGVRGKVIQLVENGVDLSMWNARSVDASADGPVRFVFSGRLIELKAVDILIDALSAIASRCDAVLDIVGDGPERSRLAEMVRAKGLVERVRFLGWLPQPECAVHIRNSDVLVLPSVHECGGAVVLEAMAAGLPVIATAWGGPADYLDDTCGILVPPTSRQGLVAGIAEAMVRLAKSPELRLELGARGRQRVVSRFDWERKVDQVVAIFERELLPGAPEKATLG